MFLKMDEKLDTLGQSILHGFHALPTMTDAVIAGGYLRDLVRHTSFKDVDVFLPKMGIQNVALPQGYKLVKSSRENINPSARYDVSFTVLDTVYLESIPVQVILTPFKKDTFVRDLIDSFDYGLCQLYSFGHDIFQTEECKMDATNRTATLLNIQSVADLPRHIARFEKMKEKYPTLKFWCPSLSIKREKKEREVTNPCSEVFPYLGAGSPPNNVFLWTVHDIMNADGSLDWNRIDSVLNTDDLQTSDYINQLLMEYDIMIEGALETPNMIPEGYAEA